jgi:hypothetical protein
MDKNFRHIQSCYPQLSHRPCRRPFCPMHQQPGDWTTFTLQPELQFILRLIVIFIPPLAVGLFQRDLSQSLLQLGDLPP